MVLIVPGDGTVEPPPVPGDGTIEAAPVPGDGLRTLIFFGRSSVALSALRGGIGKTAVDPDPYTFTK